MKKVIKEIGSGDSAIDKTVKSMWRLINRDASNPDVISKAKSLQGADDYQTIKNIFDYVTGSFNYKADPVGVEHFTAPVYFIKGEYDKYLDCDDMVGIIVVLLLASKIPARIKVIAWRRNEYTHVIAEAKYKNMWIPLDAVQGRSGFGNQIRKIIRQKIYENPMGKLVTLEDGPCCGGRVRTGGGRGDNVNQNVINIGNSDYDNIRPAKIPHPDFNRPPPKPPEPKTITKTEKVPVPYPVYKTIKTPVRVIASQPVVTYREFY